MQAIMKQAPKKAAAPEEVQPAPAPPPPKEEEELPPLEDIPGAEPSKVAAAVQESRSASKEAPRVLPTPQAKILAAPPAERSEGPAIQASVVIPSPPVKEVRPFRSPEELLKEAGVPLDPEAMLRALLMPPSQNAPRKQMLYPEVSEPEPEDSETVQEHRQEAMAKLLSNKLVPEHAAADAEAPPEGETVPSEQVQPYDEELQLTQEHAMKGALHTLFRSFA